MFGTTINLNSHLTQPKASHRSTATYIPLESRKACKIHGVLTDFVCLTCEKESCSQCLCRHQDHRTVSLSNFYKLVATCMHKHNQMQKDLRQFLTQQQRPREDQVFFNARNTSF